MFSLTPATTSVSTDAAGRPREIRGDGQRIPVASFISVRDETAAYPVESGPRTVFVVAAAGRRYRLIHLVRERRWMVEELAPQLGLARAA